MAERRAEESEQPRDSGWTRRAITGLLAGAGLSSLLGADTDAKKRNKKKKKKKKGKGSSGPNPPACMRTCSGRRCGSDGCGGSCGTCGSGTICEEGQCLAPNAYEFDRLWYHGLENPWGLAVDTNDNVYVADGNHDRIVKFTSTGEVLLDWGSHGDQPGEFYQPAGVAVSKSGRVYVADSKNHRIQKFSVTGELELGWGTVGPGDGQFQNPNGVAVHPTNGEVYVVESTMRRVQLFADATYLRTLDLAGLGAFETRGITIDGDGNIYVVNTGAGVIHRIRVDATGNEIIGSKGSDNGQLSGPWDVAVDASGSIFVADRGNNRVQVFDKHGEFVTGWGAFGGGDGQFKQPMGIDVDSDGNVYVTELANARVQKFRPVAQTRRQR
jgi:DNA-binding beta-propeller fold protein YncE